MLKLVWSGRTWDKREAEEGGEKAGAGFLCPVKGKMVEN